MGVKIEIEGWDPTHKYFGGDTIRGTVIVTNRSPNNKTLSKDLVIKFYGKAECHWKEQRKNVSHARQYLVTAFDSEIYFEEMVVLQNTESSVDNRSIKPGRSEFTFSFQFPLGIPQSYKSDHGSVTYWAEVPYPKPLAPQYSVKMELPVAAHLDLNCFGKEWAQPSQYFLTKSFWLGMGRVEAQISLPSRCFIPEDEINFTLEVVNHSRCYLKKVRVYFCQVTTYKTKTSEFKEGARLSKIKCKSVHPKGTATIEETITVPQVPPTELGGCDLIRPEYGIMIKVIATTLGKLMKSAVLEGRVPVIVGTVPLGRTIGAPPAATTLIRPISVLRQSVEFTSRRVVLTPHQEEIEIADRFTNLSANE